MQIAKLNNEELILPAPLTGLLSASGSLLSIAKIAKARGIEKGSERGGSAEWKALSVELAQAKQEFDTFVRKVASSSSTDKTMKGTKAKPVFNSKGVFVGTDTSFRKVTKSDLKAFETAEAATQARRIRELEAREQALTAKLQAAGIEA